jgi:hypothetical protein
MKISIGDLQDAFLFASAGGMYEAAAYLDRETGEFRYVGTDIDETEGALAESPGTDRLLRVPNKYDLDLGKALVFAFVAEQLPEAEAEVGDIFRHRGAYARFKDLLDDRDQLDAWYEYEHSKTLAALRDWAKAEGIELTD